MSGVFKISEAGAIGLHAAVYMAAHEDRVCRASEMASAIKASEAHLVKVLQRLARAGLVKTLRGPAGGFSLVGKADNMALKDVYEAIEGKLEAVQCVLKNQACDGTGCILGGMVRKVNEETLAYLKKTTLSELTGVFENKKANKGRK